MSLKLMKRSERTFMYVNVILFILLCISILLPFFNIIATSLSSRGQIMAGNVYIFPKETNLDSYTYVITTKKFLNSFLVTVFVTVFGTIISMILITLAAYPLSKPELKYRKPILLFFIFTMMFSGGLIPSFMLNKALGLLDNVLVLILPAAMSVYNMLLIKNFIEGIPESLEEAALIDGASDLQIFRTIILPISKPALATVSLFFAVGYWNSYFSGLMYISKPALKPLQTYLYELIKATNAIMEMTPEMQARMASASSASIQAATILAATVPILVVYPFLQKHFVKGIVVGSEK